ncbi:MAG: T9SS type A sorting domain-containing protein [Candidatus Marinimicrobia bacterium]|nr:T9SS type A sorting domain-containing protein [Candidatus Neomarinimicrobiota bacterium]
MKILKRTLNILLLIVALSYIFSQESVGLVIDETSLQSTIDMLKHSKIFHSGGYDVDGPVQYIWTADITSISIDLLDEETNANNFALSFSVSAKGSGTVIQIVPLDAGATFNGLITGNISLVQSSEGAGFSLSFNDLVANIDNVSGWADLLPALIGLKLILILENLDIPLRDIQIGPYANLFPDVTNLYVTTDPDLYVTNDKIVIYLSIPYFLVVANRQLGNPISNLDGTLSLINNDRPVLNQENQVSGTSVLVKLDDNYSAITHNNITGAEAHIMWDDPTIFKLKWENFQMEGWSEITAWYDSQDQIAITTSAPVSLQFHDPWYLLNPSEWIQPDQFRPLSEQDDGSGNVQVFLDQNEYFYEDYPIYQLKAPNFYTSPEGDIYEFTNWSAANGADFGNGEDQPTVNNITDVVFKDPGASVTANYQIAQPAFIPTDYSTIQEAINYTDLRKVIILEPGSYNETIEFNDKNVYLGSQFLVDQNPSHIENTIINGTGLSGSVVTFSTQGAEQYLAGLTLTGGRGNYLNPAGGNYYYYGGGISCLNNSNPILKNLVIENNTYPDYGGGIYCEYDAKPTIENTVITNNIVDRDGGGIYLASNSTITLNNVVVKNNTAGDDGGGIYCRGNSEIIATNTIIAENDATDDGGGIYTNHCQAGIEKVTITNNNSPDGAGIYIKDGSDINLLNTIIFGNSQYGQNEIVFGMTNSSLNLNYSLLGGGIESIGNPGGGSVMGNIGVIDSNPLFTDPSNFQYTLEWNSPCIDTGNPDSIIDLDDTIADMGAFYFPQFLASGDVNMDEYIDVLDVVAMVQFILGTGTLTDYQFQNADLNQSGTIDVLDIVTLVMIILSEDLPSGGPNGVTVVTKIIKQGGNPPYVMDVLMLTDVEVAGMQMQIDINQGYKAVNATPGDYTTNAGMTLPCSISADSTVVKFLSYGMNGESYPIGNGKILEIGLIYVGLSRNNFDPSAGSVSELLVTADGSTYLESHSVEIEEFVRLVEDGTNTLLGIPENYALHSAFPNPFNPVTTIKYDLPETGDVKIIIYDMMGREVTQLVNAVENAGYHSVKWDATSYASGAYFVKMTSDDFTQTQKVMLVK